MCDGVKALRDYEGHWHLDKRVPIAIILTMVGQLGMGLIVGTLMWAQIKENAKDISIMTSVQHQVIRIQSDVSHMKDNIDRMTNAVDRLTQELKENGRGTGWHEGRVKGDGK